MKKKLLIVTMIACLALAAFGGAAAFAATGERASAGISLLLPTSYEQYMELNDPSDFTTNGDYIAIADGSDIYLYAKDGGTAYARHSAGANVSSLQFYEVNGTTYLYFVASQLTGTTIRYIACGPDGFGEAADVGVAGSSSFAIYPSDAGTYFYYVVAPSSIVRAPMSGTSVLLDRAESVRTGSNNVAMPGFDIYGSALYYSWNADICTADGTVAWTAASTVASFAVTETGCFYISNNDHALYRAAEAGQSAPAEPLTEGSIDSVSAFDGTLYLTTENKVRGFDPAAEEYSGYEISRYSDSENRLGAGASDISVYDSKVVIADTGNGRAVVYDAGTRRYSAVPTAAAPLLVCAGEDVFAAADEYNVYLYSYDGELLDTEAIGARIYDIAYSFGSFYVISETSQRRGAIIPDGSAYTYQAADGTTTDTYLSVATDISGYIYLLDTSGSVYSYADEHAFLTGSGERLPADFAGATQIVSDFAGNITCLTESGEMLRYNKPTSTSEGSTDHMDAIDLNGLVGGANAEAVAFSFGFQSGTVYFLSDGFVAATDALAVEALDSLSAAGLYDAVYTRLPDSGFASGRLARVSEGAVTVQLDLASLADMATLNCSDYTRETEERIGVVLTQTNYGAIVVFYSEESDGIHVAREYDVRLVLDSDPNDGAGNLELLSDAETLHEPRTEEGSPFSVGYTTNDVGLYKYPIMGMTTDDVTMFGKLTTLEKSTAVTVLDELYLDSAETALDAESYYFVLVESESGALSYGFVPSDYILSYRTDGALESTYTMRSLRRGASITLYRATGDGSLTLENEEQVRAYGETDENGMIFVSYTDESGIVYEGLIEEALLYRANEYVVYVLIFVPVVTVALLASVGYLIFRKQPTIA